MWRGLIILVSRLRLRSRLSRASDSERSEPCANARLMRGDPCRTMRRATRPQGLRINWPLRTTYGIALLVRSFFFRKSVPGRNRARGVPD